MLMDKYYVVMVLRERQDTIVYVYRRLLILFKILSMRKKGGRGKKREKNLTVHKRNVPWHVVLSAEYSADYCSTTVGIYDGPRRLKEHPLQRFRF